jgi:hypothetical protein
MLVRYKVRKKLLVDPKVQGALLSRAAMYWFLFAVTLIEVVLSWNIVNGPDGPFLSHFRFDDLWSQHGIVLLAGLCLLPVLLLDVALVSNRVVGPLNRVRDTLRKLANGERVSPIQFREGDYFWPMAGELNAVSARVAELEDQLREMNRSEADTREIAEPLATAASNRTGR